ncbi:MAG TPA: response regulator [Fibrobacteria bacterium]|nr:response regulator [Fibrobacteria bacterium]
MTNPIPSTSPARTPILEWGGIVACAVFYGAIAYFCPALTRTDSWLALVWFPTGIGIAMALRMDGHRRNALLSGLLVASATASLGLGASAILAFQLGLWNTLEIALGSFLLRRVVGIPSASPAPLGKLLPSLTVAVFASAPPIAALHAWSIHAHAGMDWWSTALRCWILDGTGLVLVLMPSMAIPAPDRWKRPTLPELLWLLPEFGVLVAASGMFLANVTKPFIFIAILISLVALRKGLLHTSILIWSSMVAIMLGVWLGYGPQNSGIQGSANLELWVAATGTAFLPILIGLVVDINRAQFRSLESSESRLRSIFDAAATGLALLDSDRRILRTNPFFSYLAERAPEELLGSRLEDFATAPDGSTPPPLELPTDHSDGIRLRFVSPKTPERIRWGRVRVAPIDGAEAMLLLEVDDITDAVEAEAELRRSRSYLQTVLDNIPGLVGLWDRQMRNRFANKTFLDWYEIQPEHLSGIHLEDLLGEEVFEEVRARAMAALSGEVQVFERDFPTKTGKRSVLATFIPELEGDRIEGFYSLVADITPVKVAQQAQLDSLARLGGIIDGASEFSIIATTPDGTIQLFSKGAERMLGWNAEEMVGIRPLTDIHLPEEIARASERILEESGKRLEGFDVFAEAARQGRAESREWTYLRKDGTTVPVQLVVTALHNHQGDIDGFLGVARDTSKEREAIRAIEEAREQAERTSLMKSEFVANMSHEIRTPMNAVLGMVQLMGKTAITPNQRKYLDMIRKSGKSLLGIIDDILDFSKIEAGRMRIEPMDFLLDDLLENIANIASVNASGKDLEISMTVDPSVPTQLHGDSLRLQQVLVNLLSNALKFTMQGEVALSVEILSTDEQTIRVGFRIRDTGIGMTDEQQRRLFQPFTQVDSSNTRRFGGTGLGLTISKKLLDMMGGQIGVRSMSQIGTEFFISVPFPNTHLSEPDAQALSIQPLNILVLEDHPSSQASLEAAAARWGWKLQFAANLGECLELLERREPIEPFDALLVDGTLPDWNDRTSIEEIREAVDREITIVKTVRNAVENPADEGIRLLDGILVKPITPLALLKAFKNNLGHHAHEEEESKLHMERVTEERKTLQGVRVLLVEDNAFNQVVATETLQALGAGVDLAENGKAAVERLRRTPDAYDLVLMDVQMPVMDGYAATRAIRQDLNLKLPVVAMTAGVLPSDRDKCMQSGMDEFISKPFEVEDLVRVIRRLLSLGQPKEKQGTTKPTRKTTFNPDPLVQSLGNSTDSMKTVRLLVKQFLSTVPNSVRNGRECAGRGDLDEATRTFHNLKSSSATLGAMALSSIAQQIELGLQQAERKNLGPLFDQLGTEYDKVVQEAQRWLRANDAESANDGTSFPGANAPFAGA